MEKIKVLVIPSDTFGVGKYRSIDPHVNLAKNYPDEFDIQIEDKPNYNNPDFFKQFDIVHIHKVPSNQYDKSVELVNMIKDQGCKVIIDNDDYWHLGAHHPGNAMYVTKKFHTDIQNTLRVADLVTTTTPIFANEIKKYNTNIAVLPNGIDPTERQFIPKPTTSDMFRVGWLGGSSHREDIALIRGIFSNNIDNFQFVLCGFDTRGFKTVINKDGSEERKQIEPEDTVWAEYERMLLSNYSFVSEGHRKVLLEYNQQKDEQFDTSKTNYKRVWTRPLNRYANGYNEFDVLLAPLKTNQFNKMKSQLKLIEAGFHNKAVVAQDYGPYQIDTIQAFERGKFNPEGNAILIDPNRNHKDWLKAVKFLHDNPEKRQLIADNLTKTIKAKYDINVISATRREHYYKLIGREVNKIENALLS